MNNILNRVLIRLGFKPKPVYVEEAMAQKQGFVSPFTFYTLDSEYPSHYPHVHICVKNDKKYKRTPMQNNSLLSLGSIRLRADDNYTLENLEFETVKDPWIETNKNKKLFVKWLNSEETLLNRTNANVALADYLKSNDKCKDRAKYLRFLTNKFKKESSK